LEIGSCPKCGRPRALGYRCPSCGDTGAVAGEQSAADDAGSWRAEPTSWQGIPRPAPTGQHGVAAPRSSSGGRRGKSLVATAIVAVVLIAIIVVVVVLLTAGGAAVVEEEASVASVPDRAHDEAAQSLVRNAMMAMDAVFVETTDYTTIEESTLQAMEPGITWIEGRAGTCTSPAEGAEAQDNVVTWAGTGRMTYEIGTWSASGVEFGVKVNKAGGGATYYRDGKATAR